MVGGVASPRFCKIPRDHPQTELPGFPESTSSVSSGPLRKGQKKYRRVQDYLESVRFYLEGVGMIEVVAANVFKVIYSGLWIRHDTCRTARSSPPADRNA